MVVFMQVGRIVYCIIYENNVVFLAGRANGNHLVMQLHYLPLFFS